jgi:proteasome lid subunit RPN8/RPN11
VHNHPSGDTTPSRADIEMTGQIVEVPTTRPDPQVQIAALWIGTSRSEKMR